MIRQDGPSSLRVKHVPHPFPPAYVIAGFHVPRGITYEKHSLHGYPRQPRIWGCYARIYGKRHLSPHK